MATLTCTIYMKDKIYHYSFSSITIHAQSPPHRSQLISCLFATRSARAGCCVFVSLNRLIKMNFHDAHIKSTGEKERHTPLKFIFILCERANKSFVSGKWMSEHGGIRTKSIWVFNDMWNHFSPEAQPQCTKWRRHWANESGIKVWMKSEISFLISFGYETNALQINMS